MFLARGHSNVLIEPQAMVSVWARKGVTILAGIIEPDQKKEVGLLIPSRGREELCVELR